MEPAHTVWSSIDPKVTLGVFTTREKPFELVTVQEPTVAVAVTLYVPALVEVTFSIWIFCPVALNPLGPDHAYVTSPVVVPVGAALILKVEPSQTVWVAIFSSVTAGAFTVMVPLTVTVPQSFVKVTV